jgi:hypothetical protein
MTTRAIEAARISSTKEELGEQMRSIREFNVSLNDAGLMVSANNLLVSLGVKDQPDLIQNLRRKEVVISLVAANLLRERINDISKRPKIVGIGVGIGLVRRFIRKESWQMEKLSVLEVSLNMLNKQNAYYLNEDNEEIYPQAGLIRTLIDSLFEVIHTRERKHAVGKIFSGFPEEPLEPTVIDAWRKGYGNMIATLSPLDN